MDAVALQRIVELERVVSQLAVSVQNTEVLTLSDRVSVLEAQIDAFNGVQNILERLGVIEQTVRGLQHCLGEKPTKALTRSFLDS